LVKKFRFQRSIETCQTTNWQHSWGLTAGISYTTEASVNAGVVSGKSSLTLSAEVRYDGHKGGNQGKKKMIKFSDQTTVTVPPRKYVTVKFKVSNLRCQKMTMLKYLSQQSSGERPRLG